jgi:hypothetical protein
MFIWYILTGEEIGGQVQTRAGVSSYVIGTDRGDSTAAGIRAFLYAPGCTIQLLDIPLLDAVNPQYSFVCRPLPDISIHGTLAQRERLVGHDVHVEARYVARWASRFPGLQATIVLSIPVGDPADLSANGDGSFHLSVPDLARDPLAGAPGHSGEFQLWAKDKATGFAALLSPALSPAIRTPMGGLKLQSEYPANAVYIPCSAFALPVLIHRDSPRSPDGPCGR